MSADDMSDLVDAAEARWLERWIAGPPEDRSTPSPVPFRATDVELLDDEGNRRRLSEFWSDGPALVMFWRHFGCNCGVMRAEALERDWEELVAAGLRPVIVAPGEPARAAAYRAELALRAPILCDADYDVFGDWGIGSWSFLEVMFADPPAEYLEDPARHGADLLAQRRAAGRPVADDPWRAVADFVVGRDGTVGFAHHHANCIDFPAVSSLVAAARGD